MKKAFAGILLSLLVLCASGCRTQPTTAVPIDAETDLSAKIAELEADLQRLREQSYIRESELNAEILQLKAELDALQGTDADTQEAFLFRYNLQDGGAIITAMEGDATFLTIPATLDTYPVIGIGERAFESKHICAVTLPEGLVSIGWFAFYNCETLSDVTIPASVQSIGYAAFDGCPNVTIICSADSYAEQFAKSFGLNHVLT